MWLGETSVELACFVQMEKVALDMKNFLFKNSDLDTLSKTGKYQRSYKKRYKKGKNFHELELSPIEVTHIVKCVENDHHRQSADINQKRLLPPPPLLSVIMN